MAQTRALRLTRSRSDRVIAGVCGGAARALGLDPLVVRVVAVVLVLAGGAGAILYVFAWLLVPAEDEERSLAEVAARVRPGTDVIEILAVASITLGLLLLVRSTGIWFSDAVVWPLLLAGAGLAVIWRQAGDSGKAALLPRSDGPAGAGDGTAVVDVRSRRAALARVALGVALVVFGVGVFLAASDAFSALGQGVLASAGIVTGIALITLPWWVRLGRDLARERRERIRSEERAEVAAHLHDSVLHTLALIQRSAADPRAVVTMARHQERELRGWLYDSDQDHGSGATLVSAVTRAAEDVESLHGVSIDVVAVGDWPVDARVGALVAAAREAMINAAKWSGVMTVSVYVESGESQASVFVRDWGAGFDPAEVASGRHGLRDSISGRMARHGGTAVIRSAPGEGTEVQLRLPVDQ